MHENLILILEQRLENFNNLFHTGLKIKLQRFFRYPVKILVRLFRLRFANEKNFLVKTKTFFNYPMTVHVSETCLWFSGVLNGAEIGLQKYLILNIKPSSVFFDVGAHHGFYSLLAHHLIELDNNSGQIHAFEPTDTHFDILRKNTKSFSNIYSNKNAVCSKVEKRTFYETIGAGSTIEKDFFKNVSSVQQSDFKTIEVSCVTLDTYCVEHTVRPTFIKIDVEGSEYEVLSGALRLLREDSPIIAMEAWSKPYDNSNHIKALRLLEENNYKAYQIDPSGKELFIEYADLIQMLEIFGNSNNFIFKK